MFKLNFVPLFNCKHFTEFIFSFFSTKEILQEQKIQLRYYYYKN